MTNTVEVLVLDLIEWLLRRDRSYGETMEVWRTSCPRLPVWEDAHDLGFVCVESDQGGRALVRVTPAGAQFLRSRRSGKPN